MKKYYLGSFILFSFISVIVGSEEIQISQKTLNWHTRYKIHSRKTLQDAVVDLFGKSPEELTLKDTENLNPIQKLLLQKYEESLQIPDSQQQTFESDEDYQ